MRYQRIYAICGMLSPIIYTMMWIIGGILQPKYSHIRDDISDLLARGASDKLLMDIMNIASCILLLIFFLSLHKSINNSEGSKIGPIALIISGFLGMLVALFFPLGPNGELTDWRAVTHATIIFSQVPITIIAMIAIWRRLKKLEEWRAYGTFSLLAFILTMVFGLMTPMSIDTPIMGLVERLAICTIMIFYFMLALGAYRNCE
ncbi:MAG: DUF998 domain-containing protein [Promethearchaeota archaeon]